MHHAYSLIGTYEWACGHMPSHACTASSDCMVRTFKRMGIDDARTLIEEAQRAPLVATCRTFVLVVEAITLEAQNALLKLLEEPPRTAEFYIIVPRESVLIKTLRSRLFLLATQVVDRAKEGVSSDFMKASYAARLDMIALKAKRKDDAWFSSVLNELECVARDRGDAKLIASIVAVQTYAHTQGASKKMLLEHIALTL